MCKICFLLITKPFPDILYQYLAHLTRVFTRESGTPEGKSVD